MKNKLSVLGLKRLNPTGRVIPVSLKAKSASVLLQDLNVTIGQKSVNLFALVGEQEMYKSSDLKRALEMGLLVDANFKDDIEMLEDKPNNKVGKGLKKKHK